MGCASRVKIMARSNDGEIGPDNVALAVRLGGDAYAIPLAWVEEVLPALPVESVPQCPAFVRGVVFVRGELIPVLSAAERLGLRNYQRPLEPPIVRLRLKSRFVGVEFDEAIDLIDLSRGESLEAARLGAATGLFCRALDLDGTIIRLLDPERLVSAHECLVLDSHPGLQAV